MDKNELISLVRKYLSGKASAEEHAFIEAWYREMDSSQPIETILSVSETAQLEELIFRNIEGRIRKRTEIARSVPSMPAAIAGSAASHPRPEGAVPVLPVAARIRRLRPYAAIAASLILLVTGAWFLYHHTHNSNEPILATLYTQPGKVSKITLDDGTLVWLNADSRLKFPKSFGGSGPREVFLEGEAYFEVAKDPEHTFLVHTLDLTTRVLGTRFNVKAYPGNKRIEVTLLEGKVMLTAPSADITGKANTTSKKEDTLYLDPNQKALFSGNKFQFQENTAQNSTVRSDSITAAGLVSRFPKQPVPALLKETVADAQGSAAWRNGELVFRQEPLLSVMEALSRKYDIRIKADSSLQNQLVTATVYNRSAEEALLEVARQLKRQYKKGNANYDDKVQFRKEGNVYFIE